MSRRVRRFNGASALYAVSEWNWD